MVWEPYGCIIGDASSRTFPFDRLCAFSGSLRRRAYAATRGGMMNTRQKSEKPGAKKVRGAERLPAELSRVNLNAAGIDVGASSHFVAVPADRAEQPVREFEVFTADLYRLAD